MRIAALSLFSLVAMAQTPPYNAVESTCPGHLPNVMSLLWMGPTNKPACIAMGPTMAWSNNNGRAQIDVSSLQSSSFTLDPSLDATVQTATFALSKTPVPTAPIFITFRSSQIGGDLTFTVLPGSTNPKTLQVMLPLYRPFTPADVLTVMYWTFDQ